MISLLALLLIGVTRASALDTLVPQKEGIPLGGSEDLTFLGWNDSCSVAIQHFRYPRVGQGLEGTPAWWRIGTLTIAPGMEEPAESWSYRSQDYSSWDQSQAARAAEDLVRGGYSQPGHRETVRNAPVASHPGLKQILETTSTFKLSRAEPWPPPPYALSAIHYSPLGSCALLIFERRGASVDRYRYNLIRVLNPGVRRTRARAHATNGILLYKNSDLYAAEEELAIASEMDPDYGPGRYYHALFLAALGRFEQSLDELKVALHLDNRYAEKALKAPEFESLRRSKRFDFLLKEEVP